MGVEEQSLFFQSKEACSLHLEVLFMHAVLQLRSAGGTREATIHMQYSKHHPFSNNSCPFMDAGAIFLLW